MTRPSAVCLKVDEEKLEGHPVEAESFLDDELRVQRLRQFDQRRNGHQAVDHGDAIGGAGEEWRPEIVEGLQAAAG